MDEDDTLLGYEGDASNNVMMGLDNGADLPSDFE
jgi:hypothetical protein